MIRFAKGSSGLSLDTDAPACPPARLVVSAARPQARGARHLWIPSVRAVVGEETPCCSPSYGLDRHNGMRAASCASRRRTWAVRIATRTVIGGQPMGPGLEDAAWESVHKGRRMCTELKSWDMS